MNVDDYSLRWKYKHHISKDNNGRPQFYRSVPNHRFVLLATWGGVASNTPGFFRFPRSICTFDWLMNENIDRHFDVKKAKIFVHNLAVLDSGNDRIQFLPLSASSIASGSFTLYGVKK